MSRPYRNVHYTEFSSSVRTFCYIEIKLLRRSAQIIRQPRYESFIKCSRKKLIDVEQISTADIGGHLITHS